MEFNILPDNGRRFQFAVWGERRYARQATWEFRVKVRIEGVPVHCWTEDVAAMVLGKSCTMHHLEETTRRRQRTRSFDLWAWCSDPSDIPQEVVLTIMESDRGHPYQDTPVDVKRSQVYVLRNHLEVVEDLSFLREPGRSTGTARRAESLTGIMVCRTRRESVSRHGAAMTATVATTSGHAGKTTTMKAGVSREHVDTAVSHHGQETIAAGEAQRTTSAPTGGVGTHCHAEAAL